jgi:hypothetical protein
MSSTTGTQDVPQVNRLESDASAQNDHEAKDQEPSSPTPHSLDNESEKPRMTEGGSETDSDSYHEVERNIGVTKIEALYIVFGKGWKLVLLWL